MEQVAIVKNLYIQGEDIEKTFIKSYGEYAYDITLGKVTNDLPKLKEWLECYWDLLSNTIHMDESMSLVKKIIRAKEDPEFLNRKQFNELLESLQILNCLV